MATKTVTKVHCKPFNAIMCDYVICALFGATYYCIEHYVDITKQCIPGNSDDNPSICDETYMNNDITPLLGYPHQTNPIPTSYAYIFGAATWWIVILLSLLSLRPSLNEIKAIFIKLETLWREVLISLLITQTAVGAIKTFVGRPRPNYYLYVDVNASDAISSFPSGHSSSSFCIHILLIYHVLGAMYWANRNYQMQVTVNNTHSLFGARIWQKTRYFSSFNVLIVMCLIAIPVYISCTRITDYYHHYGDVIAGAAIGIFTSSIVFSVFHCELYTESKMYNSKVREPLLSSMSDSLNN